MSAHQRGARGGCIHKQVGGGGGGLPGRIGARAWEGRLPVLNTRGGGGRENASLRAGGGGAAFAILPDFLRGEEASSVEEVGGLEAVEAGRAHGKAGRSHTTCEDGPVSDNQLVHECGESGGIRHGRDPGRKPGPNSGPAAGPTGHVAACGGGANLCCCGHLNAKLHCVNPSLGPLKALLGQSGPSLKGKTRPVHKGPKH